MDLQLYLRIFKMTQAEFARKSGLSKQIIGQLLSRRHKPDLETTIAIMKASGGEIEPQDLLDYFQNKSLS